MMATLSSTLFFCHICSEGLASMETLKQHQIENHRELGFQEFPFSNLATMKDSHFIKLEEDILPNADGLFRCQLCEFTTHKWKKWNRHMNKLHLAENDTGAASEDVTDIVESSNLEGENISTLCSSEPNGKQPKKRYTCTQCDFSTTRAKKWDKHVSSVHGCHTEGPEQENVDEITANSLENIDSSVQNCHNGEPPSVDDDYLLSRGTQSGEQSRQPQTENRLATDHHLRPFVCYECGQSFTRKDVLKVHIRIHTGEKPYQCPQCDFATSYSRTLTNHLRRHTGNKPYKCNLCDVAFAAQVNLSDHMKNHNGIKPYKCTLCEYSSPYMNNLTAHHRTHTRERPYECRSCGKTFRHIGHVRRHEKTVHKLFS